MYPSKWSISSVKATQRLPQYQPPSPLIKLIFAQSRDSHRKQTRLMRWQDSRRISIERRAASSREFRIQLRGPLPFGIQGAMLCSRRRREPGEEPERPRRRSQSSPTNTTFARQILLLRRANFRPLFAGSEWLTREIRTLTEAARGCCVHGEPCETSRDFYAGERVWESRFKIKRSFDWGVQGKQKSNSEAFPQVFCQGRCSRIFFALAWKFLETMRGECSDRFVQIVSILVWLTRLWFRKALFF